MFGKRRPPRAVRTWGGGGWGRVGWGGQCGGGEGQRGARVGHRVKVRMVGVEIRRGWDCGISHRHNLKEATGGVLHTV